MTQNLTGIKKPVRTMSGVTPLTVVAKPYRCPHGRCTYCPVSKNAPNSYTEKSPAIMRALKVDYDTFEQVTSRLKALKVMGHPTSKIEIIYLGGTFLAYPLDYQYDFAKAVYDALNEKKSETLEDAKKLNETTPNRCVALCIETKPDWAFEEHINRMLDFGCTRVELGVQVLDDKVYKIVNRGHTLKDVVKSTQLLKDSGFKVGYHIMPGLPGSNPKNDLKKFKKMFEDDKFKPDQLKIYPLQIMKGTPLDIQYKKGKLKLYDENEMLDLVCNMKGLVPEYCRIMRVMRQFSTQDIQAGNIKPNSRSLITDRMKELGLKCKCIRCREVGLGKQVDKSEPELKILKYSSSGGKEFFISYESDNYIYGLCRARIPGKPFRKEITKKTLIIRELHVYGKEVSVNNEVVNSSQHKGIGKMLMNEAEKIAKKNKLNKIVVISGVGVKEYYRKLGYSDDGPYVSKVLK